MRNLDGTLNGDLNDNTSAFTSGSLIVVPTSSLDENLTVYSLLPIVINQPPIITKPIAEASRPKIRSAATADATGKYLYHFSDGTIKVLKGTTFELRIQATQPDTYNVENGVPVIKEADQGLFYQWRQDEAIVRSYALDTLNHRVSISGSVVRFERIQPQDAGTYTVEISNDIGAVISEPITIEVYNTDLDTFFYKNLVTNGNAINGTDGWSGDTSEFVARTFSTKTTQELKTPNRVDLFGYNVDTMHPRPYQLEMGVMKGVDYEKYFVGRGRGGYFSRDFYKFEKAGGKFYVKTFQDIDVTDIQGFVKGSIYGVDGVRAIFGCYIGNAVSSYVPTKETMLPEAKTNPANYYLGSPRISLQNFLMAGPGYVVDRVYVTLEEYDNETRLVSTVLNQNGQAERQPNTITLQDPWTKRLSTNYGKQYYPTDTYGLGSVSMGNGYDATLFTADQLYPNINDRPTHGQYLEFNRIVLERLHPKTTKIRISLHFYTDDLRIFDGPDYEATNSDRIWETVSWEKNYKKGTFDQKGSASEVDFIRSTISRIARFKDKPLIEQVPLAPPPRVAVTGLSLCLLPIERQNANATKYYTSATINKNNRPEVRIPSAIDQDAIFDPKGILKRNLEVSFQHNSKTGLVWENDDFTYTNKTTVRFKSQLAGTQPEAPIPSPTTLIAKPKSIFPFKEGTAVLAYNLGLSDYGAVSNDVDSGLSAYARLVYNTPSGSQLTTLASQSIQIAASTVTGPVATIVNPFYPPTSKSKTRSGIWKNRFSYTLYYMTRPAENPPLAPGTSPMDQLANRFNLVVDYGSTVPVVILADELKGYNKAFVVKDYGIDAYGAFYYTLPTEMITTPVDQGGLGIPTINYSASFTGITTLSVMSASLGSSSFASASSDTLLQSNLDNLFEGYLDATGINKPEPDDQFQFGSAQYAAAVARKPAFTNEITNYLYATTSSLSLTQLIAKWNVDSITATIKTDRQVPNPSWTTTLYAVSPAPQIGTNFNGTPVKGVDSDGVTYTLNYPRIVDEQTQI